MYISSFNPIHLVSSIIDLNPIPQIFHFFFKTHQGVKTELTSLLGRVSTNEPYTLSDEDKKCLKAAIQNSRKIFDSEVRSKLFQLSNEKLQSLFCLFCEDTPQSINQIHDLLDLFNTQELMNLTKINSLEFPKAVKCHAELKDVALSSVLEVKGKALWKEVLVEGFYLFHHIMEIFISITRLNEIGHSNDSSNQPISHYEAESKINLYLSILAYPSTVFGLIYAYCGTFPLSLGLTLTTLVLTPIFVYLYMRYLRPCPRSIFGEDSLTAKVLKQNDEPVFWRRDLLIKINHAFESGKGALLIGKTGCGKSSIVRSYAEYMLSNNCPDVLRNNQLFSFNTGAIKGFDQAPLGSIRHAFTSFRSQVVFFFDEIQAAFKKEGIFGTTTDSFLTFCNDFPYVIAATTDNEYKKFIKENKPFMRRFKKIKVHTLSDVEIETSLLQYIHWKAPELILEDGIITYIREKAKLFDAETSQVDSAHALFKRAICQAQILTFDQLEGEINQLQTLVDHSKLSAVHSDITYTQYDSSLEKKLKAKKEELIKKKNQLAQIKKIEFLYLTVRKNTYTLAKDALNITNQKAAKNWLKEIAYKQIICSYLQKKKKKLGLPPILDRTLINQILTSR